MSIIRLIIGFFLAQLTYSSHAEDVFFQDTTGHIFWQAEYAQSDSKSIPTGKEWVAVTMPHLWNRPDNINIPINGILWYRFYIPEDFIGQYDQGVFIDRSLSNVEVYLNQDYLGNGGSTQRPVARNWNTPLLFRIPNSSWKPHNNYLYIRLMGELPFGTLPPPAIDDYKILKHKYYLPKYTVRIDLSRASFALLILMSIFSLLLWRYTRQNLLLYAGLASALWLIPLLYGFGREIPLSHPVFLRITHWSLDICALSIFIFGQYKYKKVGPNLIKIIQLYSVFLAIVLIMVPNRHIVIIANLMHLITQLGILYMLFYSAWQFCKTRSPSDASFCIGLTVIISLFIHDVSLSLSSDLNRWFNEPHLGHLSLPIMFVLMCYSLTNMYKHYLLTAKALNTELKQRLDATKQELKSQLKKRQKLDETQRINSERERVYSDLHDDLGAKLLSLVYASPDASKNDLARTALQDLRDVVSRVKHGNIPLDALLFEAIEEQRSRTHKLDIIFDSKTNEIDSNISYSATQALWLKRLLRELVGVLVHQFESQNIQLNILVAYTGIELVASTDNKQKNYDINSLQARALKLGGDIRINNDKTSTLQLVCWIPHPGNTP